MRDQNKLREQKPWATDPKYFKHVKISALALLKMVRERFYLLLRSAHAFFSSVSPGRNWPHWPACESRERAFAIGVHFTLCVNLL